MIIVANKRDNNGKLPGIVIPIYRGQSVLGNPFRMNSSDDQERDRVCDRYKTWLDEQIAKKDISVCSALNHIYSLVKERNPVYLVCFCAPKRCHGDYIKKIIEDQLRKRGYQC
jgi:hypothetical protein